MTEMAMHRLSLMVAAFGVLLMIGLATADYLVEPVTLNLPRFQKSKPALADWPRYYRYYAG